MAVVGSAEIIVRAITNKVKDDIRRAFKDAVPGIEAEGKRAAQAYSESFSKHVSGNLHQSISRAVGEGGRGVEGIARQHGQQYASSFSNSLEGIEISDAVGRATERAMDRARDQVDRAGAELGAAAERSLGSAGGRGGNAFERALNSGFSRAAQGASRRLTIMIATGNLLGVAISVLVASLSSLIGGLFAMASAASVAAGALGVLPAMMAVAAQGAIALKLAFAGVGNAISAGFKAAAPQVAGVSKAAQTAARAVAAAQQGLARAQQESARRVRDARDALNDAYQSAARSAADAARRVADAERSLLSQQRELISARRALNAAYREGAEELQQLAFAAEDAVLGEERAQLNLEEATLRLQEAQSLPPDDRGRREAELSYKEAELAYRRAKDRANDTTEEQRRAAQEGVRGTDAVRAAIERVRSAQEGVASAERDLADARRQQAETHQDNLESIREAQQNLRDAELDGAQAVADARARLRQAQADANAATNAGAASADAYKQALAELSPEARKFVRYIVSLKDEFDSLQASAGRELFPKLQRAMEPIVNRVFPLLEKHLQRTGSLLGDAALGIGRVFEPGVKNRLAQFLEGNNDILEVFTERGKHGENTFSKLVRVLLRLGVALQPVTKRFAEWIKSLVDGWAAATNSRKEMDKLTGFFNKAGNRAALLGRIIGNLFGILGALGKAADPAGMNLLRSFEKATEKFEKFLKTPEQQAALRMWFNDASENFKAIAHLIGVIVVEFLKIGDNLNIAKTAKALEPAVKNFGELGNRMASAGPTFAALVDNISRIMLAFAETRTIELFISVLGGVADLIADILESDIGGWALKWIGLIAAVTRSVGLLALIFGFFIKAVVGGPLKVIGAISKIGKAFTGLRKGGFSGMMAALRGKGGGAKTSQEETKRKALQKLQAQAEATGRSIRDLALDSEVAERAFREQMGVDRQKTAALAALDRQADETGRSVRAAGATSATGATGAAAAGGKHAAPKKQGFFARRLSMRNEGGFMAAPAVLSGTKALDDGAKKTSRASAVMSKSMGGIGKAAGGVGKAIGGLGRGIMGFVGGPIGLLITFMPLIVAGFKKLYDSSPEFRKFVDGIVEKAKQLVGWFMDVVWPKLKQFAEFAARVFREYVVPALNSFFAKVNEVMPKIGAFFADVFRVIQWAVLNILVPIIKNVIIPYIKFMWKVWSGIFKAVMAVVKVAFNIIKFVVMKILVPIIKNVIIPYIKFMWKVWSTIFKAVWNIVKTVFGWIKGVWNRVLRPVIDAIKGAFSALWDRVKSVFGWIKDKFNDFKRGLQIIKNWVDDKVDAIKKKFNGIKDAVGNAFNGLGKSAKGGINAFIKFLNNNLIDNVNKVTGKFGLKIPKIPELAQGGRVQGRGGETEDNLPHMLSKNEFVVRAKSARGVGYSTMEYINKHGELPPMGGLRVDFVDVAKGIGDKVKGVGELGKEIAKEGVGKILAKIVDVAIGMMSGAGIKRGPFLNDFFYAIMEKLKSTVRNWGGDVGKGGRGGAGGRPYSGSGVYGGPGGPWTHPLGRRYAAYNYPGHSPSWAVDIAAPGGSTVRAASAGVVAAVSDLGARGYGRYIVLAHRKGIATLYAHLSRFLVRSGQSIKSGQSIGLSGRSGSVFGGNRGQHLHFEMIPGRDTIAEMRRRGVKLATGGIARSTSGGILSVIAEAGSDERVEPLDSQGMSKRDKVLLGLIADLVQNGRGDVWQINPAPGMNEIEFAKQVKREVTFNRRRGGR